LHRVIDWRRCAAEPIAVQPQHTASSSAQLSQTRALTKNVNENRKGKRKEEEKKKEKSFAFFHFSLALLLFLSTKKKKEKKETQFNFNCSYQFYASNLFLCLTPFFLNKKKKRISKKRDKKQINYDRNLNNNPQYAIT
jgi:hypothetical protein